MADDVYDLAVIGGGINGAGIAADATSRGLRVLLAEAADLAGATSSASSKLIHGGLRYLETYSFRLVREALAEREVLLAKAPHIIWPLRFILPQVEGMRPAWMLRAGLFLYDNLADRRSLPGSSALDLAQSPAGAPLKAALRRGYCYWDCWVDDARLVVLNAMAAREGGAEILTRTSVTRFQAADGNRWLVTLTSPSGERQIMARALVNAAGPWVGKVAGLGTVRDGSPLPRLRLVKGSHIVVPRIAGAENGYIFQNTDGRVVFALPFERAFTLIGTTDEPFSGDPRAVSISPAEELYLLDLANRFFRKPLVRDDIVWKYAGVRPLDDDGTVNPSAVNRDYRLELDKAISPPLMHVIGGKITTYRRLSEAAVDLLAPRLNCHRASGTMSVPLPGGDIGSENFQEWLAEAARRRPGFDPTYLACLARRYGTRLDVVLGDAKSATDLGPDLGSGLRPAEVVYLKRHEWAEFAEDVMWRRTKTGLHVAAADRARVAELVQRQLDLA